jgi:CAAX protease family protein
MTARNRATLAYAAPFAVFVGLMGIEHALALAPQVAYPVRFLATLAAVLLLSRNVVPLRPSTPLASAVVGIAVFFIWIGPDLLFGPRYRHSPIFENSWTGTVASSLPAAALHNALFLSLRVASSVLLVPVIEELFWRGWLMRWLIHLEFWKVPIGQYAPAAFWLVALMFGAEHGPYWDVGLLAGIVYNAWAVRTKNLADCILAHAVTNALLAGYVLFWYQWQYWL